MWLPTLPYPWMAKVVPEMVRLSRARSFAGDDRHAEAGGRLAAGRAVILDRLARDAGWMEPLVLSVFVHDPGHHLRIGPHVRRGDVLVRPDHVVDLLDELAGQALHLAPGQLVGIAVDPPLGTAEGKVDKGRLPGHQAGQRPGFILVDGRMVAQPPLERPAGIVVLHPVADEVADLPRIELDHDLDADLAIGRDHERSDVFRQIEAVRRLIEVVVRRLEGLHQSAVPWINWTLVERTGPANSLRS